METSEPGRVIVVGASAGGVDAITRLAAGLPATLAAAVCVVLHFPSDGVSVLPRILQRAGPLPAGHPRDGEPLLPGRIYVAPPGCHLVVRRGHLRLSRGPKENGVRPAVDVLFRTAARAYGPAAIGVVLSGTLDDGTAGLAAIRQRGGITLAQDPEEAAFSGMPRSAINGVGPDFVATLDELSALLARLVSEPPPALEEAATSEGIEVESDVAEMSVLDGDPNRDFGEPSDHGCPECGGVLWLGSEPEVVRFRCRIGHAYSGESLLTEQASAVEAALRTALTALEEKASLATRMRNRMEERHQQPVATRFAREADEALRQADLIRDLLRHGGSDAPHGAHATGTEEQTETGRVDGLRLPR